MHEVNTTSPHTSCAAWPSPGHITTPWRQDYQESFGRVFSRPFIHVDDYVHDSLLLSDL